MSMSKIARAVGCLAALVLVSECTVAASQQEPNSDYGSVQLSDDSSGENWPGPGRTFGEQHFSPLSEISTSNVNELGLVWSMDLPPGNSVSQPLEIDGVLYFCTGYSIIHAVEAATGKQLWTYDPKAPEAAGKKLRLGWGSRVSPGGTAISTRAHRTAGS